MIDFIKQSIYINTLEKVKEIIFLLKPVSMDAAYGKLVIGSGDTFVLLNATSEVIKTINLS